MDTVEPARQQNILMVSPYSGRAVGGGLAVMSQELTKAFGEKHSVKLVTMEVPNAFKPDKTLHGKADIIFIENEKSATFDQLGSNEEQRNELYKAINSDEVVKSISIKLNGFYPDIIIGHSRFSGPAAIKLKKQFFPKAKVEYFLHSYPIEGSILVGHKAYDEPIDDTLAHTKLTQEKEWMAQADVAVGVGPLLRCGATLILGERNGQCRVHECIPGTSIGGDVTLATSKSVQLLMSGRANVPIKGFEDLLLAVGKLREKNSDVKLTIRGWAQKRYNRGEGWADEDRKNYATYQNLVLASDVQKWAEGVLGVDGIVKVEDITKEEDVLRNEICQSWAVLMPSYAEHFGLVPFDALGLGVPVLMSEVSGAAMFLGDKDRFKDLASSFIVHDFGAENTARPLIGRDFLTNVGEDAFDRRPEAWAAAIDALISDKARSFERAAGIRKELRRYTWQHCAQALISAAYSRASISKQGPDGTIIESTEQ
jgi:glycosyltransferase involved in cell wall biosynthesis